VLLLNYVRVYLVATGQSLEGGAFRFRSGKCRHRKVVPRTNFLELDQGLLLAEGMVEMLTVSLGDVEEEEEEDVVLELVVVPVVATGNVNATILILQVAEEVETTIIIIMPTTSSSIKKSTGETEIQH
jgi:hypothetical protein